MISLILLVFAFVLFCIAAWNVPAIWNLVAAGLALWVLSSILATSAIVTMILLAFAFVLFAIATFNVQARFNLIAAGLAFWVAALLFTGFGSHLNLH